MILFGLVGLLAGFALGWAFSSSPSYRLDEPEPISSAWLIRVLKEQGWKP